MGTQKNCLNETFENQKHMFKLMGKETNASLGEQTNLIWTEVKVSKFMIVGTDRIKVQKCR